MGDAFPGDHDMGFRLFPLIKFLKPRGVTDGKLGGLHIGPTQIFIAIFDIALAFPLVMPDFDTLHTPPRGGVVAHGGKVPNVPRFQDDRLG